jgi:hypothetical protein
MPVSIFAKRADTVKNGLEVALNVPPEEGVVEIFGVMPKIVSIASTSSCKRFG